MNRLLKIAVLGFFIPLFGYMNIVQVDRDGLFIEIEEVEKSAEAELEDSSKEKQEFDLHFSPFLAGYSEIFSLFNPDFTLTLKQGYDLPLRVPRYILYGCAKIPLT